MSTTPLSDKAQSIWMQLGDNARSNAATTIAVVFCADQQYYCTSNDVSNISPAAIQKARTLGISKTGNDYISQAGAGFHAEMWMIIQALHAEPDVFKVNEVLQRVGASRACCNECTAVLQLLHVQLEMPSNTQYGSWFNPITMDETCNPRANYTALQYRNIPDFRQNNLNYWFDAAGRPQNQPPNTAK
jgi:hypothetical protein